MSITCRCSLCGKIYQVKSRFAGKQARCSCGNVMHVPEAQSDGGGPSSAAAGRPHGAILFLCPQCGYQARVAAWLEGKKASCPGCKTVVVVDAAPATPGSSATTSARENVPQVDQESGYLEKIRQQGGALARKLIEKGQQVYDHAILQVSALDSVQSDAPSAIPIGEDLVIGRDPEACQYILDHPGISRQHARIERSQPDYLVTDLKSANGTYVNGRRILGRAPLEPGDMLNIGPFTFTIDGAALVPVADADKVEIVCSELCRDVTDWTSGEQIRILNDITLLLQPREFTVIIGPSGGGKSTLLNALSARRPATSGVVLFNRQNLYTHFDAIRKNMALVPQKDVLHSELQLGRALLYTARLRLPPDLGTEGYMAVVDEYLETVGLTDCKTTQIRSLSGGQVKRASLANEIISQPNLLFVDEATSGVDEHTDGEIMQIFREIAEGGKTVVCITHNLTNVEKSCHKVVILAPGGFLAFVGTPGEARSYFDIDTLGDVYYRLNDKPGEQWKNEFAATPVYQQMQRDVQERVQSSQVEVEMRRSEPLVRTLVVFFRQLFLLSRRGFDILVADTKSLMVTGVQCLFIAFLICVLFGRSDPQPGKGGLVEMLGVTSQFELPGLQKVSQEILKEKEIARRRWANNSKAILFLLVISGFWFGCNNAAKEIVKDKEIYERERDVCLNVISYYLSKFLLLSAITTLQIMVLFLLVKLITGFPNGNLVELLDNSVLQLNSLVFIGVCGVATGLLISTVSSNTDMAVTLVPIAVIPQVILAGAIWEIDGGLAELLSSCFISCYWAFGSAMSTLPNDVVEITEFDHWSYGWGILVAIHIGILVVAANAILHAVDKRLSLQGTGIDRWLSNATKAVAEARAAVVAGTDRQERE